ncbi:2-amino-4-hydroxy-6-hydroxymethyldihydropteridine diphosphokinase [Pasteurella langaaensis DSM 22999]|uniref:2-amino-4-hydroxy-6-hydroxymethyldihydropteridine pyrophosphokinase n=1 Tax=Alitibacter langaaensis DSM 22999 TaxID=1122935 RepID=A0A2U0TAM5_9PAST|nr:2-amino-4-hydroxy-6-hydroxymethyldihydropteridine diphosphokinase [Pasteurella langaaensis]PVX40629.1 2-amino-4-hydroxy-6-hydroxymethyldihydropteridine diphosphokinase [Pasteurella langaaensis DSM 22999]
MTTVYIALGSNLNTPIEQLDSAVLAISQLPQTKLGDVSPYYGSKPMGPQDQPDYVNAVLSIETTLSPITLLDELQRIENEQGRVRLRRWGERTLDLDILLYGDLEIQSERLTVPHYDMQNREFVIVPLFDIAPNLVLPNKSAVKNLRKNFEQHKMVLIKKAK